MKHSGLLISLYMTLFISTMFTTTVWAQTQPARGDGSKSNPFQIETADQLLWFARYVNGQLEGDDVAHTSASALLLSDIDLYTVCHPADTENGIDEVSWAPIGQNSSYQGIFDGNSMTISNLYINSMCVNAGLFGKTGIDAEIRALTLKGTIISTADYAGLMVGGESRAQISSCNTYGSVTAQNYAGGIAGLSEIGGYITSCNNYAEVTGLAYVGGLAGYAAGTFRWCNNYGNINGNGSYIGGIAGTNFGCASMVDCMNYGFVSATSDPGDGSIGGIVGANGDEILRCGNFADVSGWSSRVGGIAGESNCPIRDCINVGNVTGGDYIGGLCGYNYDPTTANCFTMGSVVAWWGVAGIVFGSYEGDTPEALENVYYVSGSTVQSDYSTYQDKIQGSGLTITTPAIAVASLDVTSGALAYRLELNADGEGTWGQNITSEPKDKYPTLHGARIYVAHAHCDGTPYEDTPYCNDSAECLTDDHLFDAEHTYEEVAPTCTSDGHIAYSECTYCHQFFDREGVKVENVVIPGEHILDEDGICTRCRQKLAFVGDGESSGTWPYGNYANSSLSFALYNGGVIGSSGAITDIAYKVTEANTMGTSELKIYMAMSNSNYLREYEAVSNLNFTQVYSGNPTLGNKLGWETLKLDTPFDYDCNQQLVIAIYRQSEQCNGKLKYAQSEWAPAYLYTNNDVGLEEANDGNEWSVSWSLPDLQLTFSTEPEEAIAIVPLDNQRQKSSGFDLMGRPRKYDRPMRGLRIVDGEISFSKP